MKYIVAEAYFQTVDDDHDFQRHINMNHENEHDDTIAERQQIKMQYAEHRNYRKRIYIDLLFY